jgi:hypothetical protein
VRTLRLSADGESLALLVRAGLSYSSMKVDPIVALRHE